MSIFKKQDTQKLQPQAVEVEEAVLGAMMILPNYITASELLKPEIFYKEKNIKIYTAIQTLISENIRPDSISVYQKLKAQGEAEYIGGATYLTTLTGKATHTFNFDYYCRILIEHWLRREFIRLCSEMANNSFDETYDILDLIQQFKKDIEAASNVVMSNNISTLKDAFKEVYNHICSLSVNPDYKKKLLTGFTYYDKFTHGLQKGDLNVIAAPSSHGKTSFATQMAIQTCKLNKDARGLFYSFEMPKEKIASRILANATGINSKRIENEPMNNENIKLISEKIGTMENLFFLFDDKICNNSEMIMSSIKSNVTKYNLDFVVVDYLQLIKIKSENIERAIHDICNDLKNIALNYKITIILVSQLSRGEGRPTLNRLKYSSAIEHAADQVLLIWRPNYNEDDDSNAMEIAEIDIAKGRNVGLAHFKLNFNPELTSFSNYTGEDFNVPKEKITLQNYKPF